MNVSVSVMTMDKAATIGKPLWDTTQTILKQQRNSLDMQTQELQDLGTSVTESIVQRILHTLSIYPKLSPSMLQVGIGTGMSPSLWHPVLEQMVSQGLVRRQQVSAQNPVTKREQTYTIITSANHNTKPTLAPD